MVRYALLGSLIVLCTVPAAVSAEALQKRWDADGAVHFGTSANPNLCCMCQPAVDYGTSGGRTRFHLRHGLERTVANERVYLSTDGAAWYCEGLREMGRSGRKCGLVPQGM